MNKSFFYPNISRYTFSRYVMTPILLSSLSASVIAEDLSQMDEIIVRADFREATLHSTAGSLTVMTGQQLQDRAAQHIEDVLNIAPNVNFSSGSSRARFFQIRGIGERSEFAQPINPSVGFIIDDVDFTGLGTAATLFDVEQVEVLRGPQGTRYGANALAGLINVRSNPATDSTDLRIEVMAAQYDSHSIGLVANAPLIAGTLYGRIAISQYRSDGYIDNKFLQRSDTNNRDELTSRVKLRWLAGEDTTVDISLMHIDVDNGYDAFSLDNNRNTLSDEPGTDAQLSDAISFNIQHNLNGGLKLEAIIAYSDSELEYSYDEDWTYIGIHDWGYSSFDQYLRDRENYSLEFRLLSADGGEIFNGSSDWVVGVYYADKDDSLERNYTYNAGPFYSDYETQNSAIYGQVDTALSDKLTLITGLRLEQWDADYDNSDLFAVSNDELLVGVKIALSYRLNDKHMTYMNLSRGYKAGGVNTDGSLEDDNRVFDTEYLWNFEVGVKSSLLEDSLNARLTVFYTERYDQQLKGSIVNIREDMGGTEFIDLIENADGGNNYGLEAEIDWQIDEQLRIYGSLGLLQTKLDNYITPDGVDMSGRDLAHAPNYQFNIGAQYWISAQWTASLEVEGKDGFYFSNRHNEESDSFEILNARLAYSAEDWHVALWGRNLTDERYETRGFAFANDPRDEYESSGYQQLGEPRIIGLTASYNF